MARYSLAVRTTSGTNATAAAELRTAATSRVRVMEIGIWIAAATASTFGIGRPQAIGVTPTSPVTVLALDPADAAGTATVALAWATGPTVPLAFFRRGGVTAAIGAGMLWSFGPSGLIIPVSSSIVVWVLATSSVADVVFDIDE